MPTNTNQVRGFVPVASWLKGSIAGKRQRFYIPSTDGTAVYVGDLVKLAGSADANGVPTVAVAASGDTVVGAVTSVSPNPDSLTTLYRAASTARYVEVCVDPDAVYEIQEDAVGGALAVTDVGLNASFITASGNTTTGMSGWQLDTSTKATTSSLDCQILGFSQKVGNAVGTANAKVLVRLNNHQYKNATTGV